MYTCMQVCQELVLAKYNFPINLLEPFIQPRSLSRHLRSIDKPIMVFINHIRVFINHIRVFINILVIHEQVMISMFDLTCMKVMFSACKMQHILF